MLHWYNNHNLNRLIRKTSEHTLLTCITMAKLSNGTLYGSMGSTGCNAKADEGSIDASNVEVLNGERFIHPGVGEGQS